jgi:predicted TIM-barrel fold metal-dependent hydrolase
MRIIANHAHLMPPADMGGCGWPAGDADMLLKHLDDCGIEKAVIFPPFACQVRKGMKAANLWALGQARMHPDRFIPAGTVFPLADDILEVLDILHAEGIRLAKVHPCIDFYDIADPRAGRCYAKAEALGIALDYHTGPHGAKLSMSEPTKYDDLAWDYPKLKLVFEHIGGRTYFEQFMAILANHDKGRVFGGLASVFEYEVNKMWYLGPERILDLVKCVGADTLIFGLDFPWNPAETSRLGIKMIMDLPITAEEKAAILGGNLAVLVGA